MTERSSIDSNNRLLSAMTPCQMLNLWSRNNEDTDRFSFEDSDRFEEDSLCSWSTEHDSLCNNWRGWKNNNYTTNRKPTQDTGQVVPLCELAACVVASHIPFEVVEHVYPPVPEQLQLLIAFWSFPDREEDIRLYSCLANSSSEEYQRGENLFKSKAVKEPLQIGFHLSATVVPPTGRGQYNVAVTFDRRRITSCNCTCQSAAYWCAHIVAVCLHRIHLPHLCTLRAPVSESLSRLRREQLQKFAQYLISELPQQILPTAQRLLDDLLSPQPSAINSVCGAPDPTAGASANEQTAWYLDEKTIHDNIKKILIKFCVPAPMVFSDVNYLTTTAPPAASEWTSLLRPLRGREPEGMWNLLSIVREMLRRNDGNALPLLEIVTEECMTCEQVMVWWFNTRVALQGGASCHWSHGGKHGGNMGGNTNASQHAGAALCDEIVVLWRLAALNPGISPDERSLLERQFKTWHMKIVEKVMKSHGVGSHKNSTASSISFKQDVDIFSGFKPAIEACFLDWDTYPIPGITCSGGGAWLYHTQPFTAGFKHTDTSNRCEVNSSHCVVGDHHLRGHTSCYHYKVKNRFTGRSSEHKRESMSKFLSRRSDVTVARDDDGVRSSVSSEGFCENNEPEDSSSLLPTDESDSQEGGGSDSSASVSLPPLQLSLSASDSPSGDDESDYSAPTPAPPTAPAPVQASEQAPGPSSAPDAVAAPVASSSNKSNDDDYNVYYYDPNAVVASVSSPDNSAAIKNTYESVFANLNKTLDPWEILFARAEGLHAHGHSKEACKLGVRLAEELLANPPNLTIVDIPATVCKQGGRRRNKHINPASWHQVSVVSSNTLQKCAFLCSVLTEYEAQHHLAFRVALYGLEMARPPASTKPLEVKLAHQESELVSLLKRIPLSCAELDIIRDRATQLKDGVLRSRGDALLPISLAGFILDALVTTANQNKPLSGLGNKKPQYNSDEVLGFEAAVAALGLKANVSEAEHPLLCEGTRRQRGELAFTLLVQYKDEPVKIARIMDKLLDREVHQLLKTPVVPWYYSNQQYVSLRNASGNRRHHNINMLLHREATESQQASAGSGAGESLESSLASICLNPPPLSLTASAMPSTSHPASAGQGNNNMRKESSRFKSKRNYPCIPNQPSEASAHFTFELSKTLLVKAGGNASTSLFTQPSASTPHHGSHRGLHMCAFQLGLYALGLHNCVSHNWLSRTYSSHVSWLSGQAMELGTPAILFLIDTWEGHLTPPEAASIADKASRGCDPHMTRAAAELALSCLPHAHALNPNEITRAILQCKEQSDLMLEHACLLVENAAKGGGVYPEVLFQVAKYWFELYLRQAPPGNDQNPFLEFDPTPPPEEMPPQPPLIEQFHHPMYLAPPYSLIPTHWPAPHQMYPAFQYPPHSANQQPAYTTQLFSMRVNPHPHHPAMFTTMQVSDGQGGQITVLTSPQGPPPPPPQLMQHPPPPPQQPPPPNQQVNRPPHQQVPRQQFRYLLSAYRVGMLAMDTLARRIHDDRPQAKYARNPPYGEDVKWLLRIAAKLGSQYLHQFCVCAVNSIISPFVLHDVAFEAAHYLSRNTPALIVQHLRTTLAPLMTKCQQMYIHCMNQKLYHLSGADHEDFVSIVCSARNAYEINPNGAQQFKEWLQSIRKSKSCKKDLWQQIQNALQNNAK